MESVTIWSPKFAGFATPRRRPTTVLSTFLHRSFFFGTYATQIASNRPCTSYAKKRMQEPDPVLDPTIVEQVTLDDEEAEEEEEEEEEEEFEDDYDFEDEFLESDTEPLYAGDGGDGGGISLAGTWWDKPALELAEEITRSFQGELAIYAFKTFPNSIIRVRIEKLSNRYGSPTMEDIEAFSKAYRTKLNEAEVTKAVPVDISLEVSSPGAERVVRIPQDLDRYKDRSMYVKYYVTESGATEDGVFRLVFFDMETKHCTWGLADVKVNREKAGKGRPLSKKQRDWRLDTDFASLQLVRLHSDS